MDENVKIVMSEGPFPVPKYIEIEYIDIGEPYGDRRCKGRIGDNVRFEYDLSGIGISKGAIGIITGIRELAYSYINVHYMHTVKLDSGEL